MSCGKAIASLLSTGGNVRTDLFLVVTLNRRPVERRVRPSKWKQCIPGSPGGGMWVCGLDWVGPG